MNIGTYLLSILAASLTLVIVIELLRRRRLRERHAIWWLVGGIGALVLSLFPGIVDGLAAVIGIEEPVNLVFFFSLIILFLVCVQFSAELTALDEKTRILAEEAALMDRRLALLERERGTAPGASPRSAD
ncbi:DUF2304 domain-containing protein [Planctomonas psychrotolerans]|uniref:DUF2304 domain-containing protein n=1 Tax=Planctomonas psychrotolerans TaxID=2528712 RepID=UPI00123A5CAB|nr:DUF2304 domain-containing protein [Planctomonas psychrotolerans]